MIKTTPSERTIYAPVIHFLNDLGFVGVQEVKGAGFVDILLEYNDEHYVLEIKICDNEKKSHICLIEGIVQVYGYGQKYKTENIITIVYPNYYRKEKNLHEINEFTIDIRTEILSLTKYWYSKERLTIREFFQTLKEKIDGEFTAQRTVSFIVEVLRDNVKKLSDHLITYYASKKEIKQLIDTVGENHELFLSLGNFKTIEEFTEKEKFVAIDLISYLLLNQILFYSIYTKLAQNIPIIDKELKSVNDLNFYFDELKKIDYKSIYEIDIINNNLIPDTPDLVKDINETIGLIKAIKPELIRHDLFGRIFHTLLPQRTRKVLSAFYTGVPASEILAGLTIRDWRSSVWDVSCGSGTLLVSAYLFKKELYERLQHVTAKNLKEIHKTFIEEHLTGTDLMPFACHLAAINLSTLNVSVTTDNIRIAHINSLECYKEIGKENPNLRPASNTISEQIKKTKRPIRTLNDFNEIETKITNPDVNSKGFPINRVDVILMNPPFTDRNKMPKKYRESLFNHEILAEKSGHDVNLWGYFLALADELTKDNGRIGAIIPMNFLRGHNTKKIREYIFNKYHVEFIIKPVGDFSFSEDSNYKDIMLILEKKKNEINDRTGFVLLKESIQGLPLTEARILRDKIQGQIPGVDYSENDFDIYWVNQNNLKNRDNLMPYIYSKSNKNKKYIDSFTDEIFKNLDKLKLLEKSKFKEGIKSPKNFNNYYYITRNFGENRIKRSFLFFDDENKDTIDVKIKGKPSVIEIEKKVLYPSLRTLTGLKHLDITGYHDYVIKNKYQQFNDFELLLKPNEKSLDFSWSKAESFINRAEDTHIVLPNRIRLTSNNTHLICHYFDYKIKPTNSFFSLKYNKEDSKIISLSLNSIMTICQFLQVVSTSTGKYYLSSVGDWEQTLQIDPDKLTDDEKGELLSLFDKLRGVEFPPLLQQITEFNEYRILLDKTILKIVGLSHSYIEKTLPKIYETVVDELS